MSDGRAGDPVGAGVALGQARRALAQAFRAAGLDSPDLDARLLVGHALRLDHTGLARHAERPLTAQEAAQINALASRRLEHEPVARILGHREFWSLDLALVPATLVPRPETETVVEAALAAIDAGGGRHRTLQVADLGTGSGALLLALLRELPMALGIGTDLSLAALDAARANAARHGLSARAHFVNDNFSAALAGPFDLMVSNPPYIARADIAGLMPEVRDHDPLMALDGGDDGLAAYRAIAADAPRLLAPRGTLVVELGAGQEPAVAALFSAHGLVVERPARADLAGVARALTARPKS